MIYPSPKDRNASRGCRQTRLVLLLVALVATACSTGRAPSAVKGRSSTSTSAISTPSTTATRPVSATSTSSAPASGQKEPSSTPGRTGPDVLPNQASNFGATAGTPAPAPTTSVPDTSPPPTSHTLVYSLTGSCPGCSGVDASATYTNGQGQQTQDTMVPLPVTFSGTFTSGSRFYISAYIDGQDSYQYPPTVGCSVSVDGTVIATNSSYGFNAIVECGGEVPAKPTPPQPGNDNITYQVSEQYPSYQASVTYTNAGEQTAQDTDASTPWSVPTTLDSGQPFDLSAQCSTNYCGTETTITCTVNINGATAVTNTSSGPGAIVDCRGTAP